MLWNIKSNKYHYRNARNERMEKVCEEIGIDGLTADCVKTNEDY
jgi:hypothetical protein